MRGALLAAEQIEEVFPLPRALVGEGRVFMLRVAGGSMINAAIANGDSVVVHPQETADRGRGGYPPGLTYASRRPTTANVTAISAAASRT